VIPSTRQVNEVAACGTSVVIAAYDAPSAAIGEEARVQSGKPNGVGRASPRDATTVESARRKATSATRCASHMPIGSSQAGQKAAWP
jgi:hypothetical protein